MSQNSLGVISKWVRRYYWISVITSKIPLLLLLKASIYLSRKHIVWIPILLLFHLVYVCTSYILVNFKLAQSKIMHQRRIADLAKTEHSLAAATIPG